MKRLGAILALAAFWVAAAVGADVTGKWSGPFKATTRGGGVQDGSARLILKQTGTEITGSVGPHESEQHAISKGKIEGDKITLESSDGGMVIKLELVLAGDKLSGVASATGDGGGVLKAKLDLPRQK